MEGCFSFFTFAIIVIVVISNVIQTAKKQGAQSGNILGSVGNLLQTSTEASPTAKPVRTPINWHIVKLNLSKEQMAECFDLAAFKSGVKKKDFPKYVYLDKLRKYFSDAQLQDMIDMDFFRENEEKSQPVFSTPESRLKGLTCKTESGALEKARKDRNVYTPKFPDTSFSEAPVREVVFEKVSSDSSDSDSVMEHINSEEEIAGIAEMFNLEPHECMFLERIAKRFTTAENRDLAMVLRDIAANSSCGNSADDPVSGIIWSEILNRPDPSTRMKQRFPQYNRRNIEFQKY
jgi:hypothetical protein